MRKGALGAAIQTYFTENCVGYFLADAEAGNH
jgi:hypothetical protein